MSAVPELDWHGVAVLVGLLGVFVVMARDRVPLTVVSLAVIALLALGFRLFPYEGQDGPVESSVFFAGFAHEALIAICSLMVLGRGLVMTGALEPMARGLAALWGRSAHLAMLAVLVGCMALSGVVNDTPIVVLMTPVLISLAARTSTSPGTLLMPMNFAVLIGGTATSIGTSTNLLVVSLAAELGAARFGVFDFAPLVAIAAVPALLYLLVVAPRLLARVGSAPEPAARRFDAAMRVLPGSFADGKTISELRRRCPHMTLRAVQNSVGQSVAKLPTMQVRADFLLHVTGSPVELKEGEALLGCPLYVVDSEAEPTDRDIAVRRDDDLHLAQVIVSSDSGLIGQRFDELHLSQQYGLQLLAVHRAQAVSQGFDVRRWAVHAGDVLLVQGFSADVARIKGDTDLLPLDGTTSLPRSRKAALALAIMAGVVGAAAFGFLPISVAALTGAVLMLLTRCVLPRNLGRAVSAEVILLIPASLAMGEALTATGGAQWLAEVFLSAAGDWPTRYVLAAIIALMSVMTNFVSNNAAAVIGTPIAVAVAVDLGVAPEPFALAVLFGCNLCFATPFGYQTNLIVMSAAGYRFVDFFRVGFPLTVLMIVAYAWILPNWYGL